MPYINDNNVQLIDQKNTDRSPEEIYAQLEPYFLNNLENERSVELSSELSNALIGRVQYLFDIGMGDYVEVNTQFGRGRGVFSGVSLGIGCTKRENIAINLLSNVGLICAPATSATVIKRQPPVSKQKLEDYIAQCLADAEHWHKKNT